MEPKGTARWRWRLKTALASAVTTAHDHGFTGVVTRSTGQPLVLGYHRVVDDYHSVAKTEMASMLIGTRMFERHLDCIGRRFDFVSLDEVGEHAASGQPFERPVAAITFDDGYRDVYEHAFPILKRKGIPAAIFVVTDLVGKPLWQVHDRLYHLVAKAFSRWDDPRRELTALFERLNLPADSIARHRSAIKNPLVAVSSLLPELSLADVRRLMDGLESSVGNGFYNIPLSVDWSELAAMQRAGVVVGSHTKSHVSLPMESPGMVAKELLESKRAIEAHLGAPAAHFAYPGGQFTPAVIEAVADAGYRFAYTACRHGDPHYPALTIDRLLLWEGSSVDAAGDFSDAILSAQAQDLWPPSRRCERVHVGRTDARG